MNFVVKLYIYPFQLELRGRIFLHVFKGSELFPFCEEISLI